MWLISTTILCEAAIPVKTHSSAVVLCPSRDIWPRIQAIRETHDRNIRRWMPHITMLYPFVPRSLHHEALLSRVGTACASLSPFEITLARFQHFVHGRNCTVWLDPHPVLRIDALQIQLSDAFPDHDDVRSFSSGFTPHLSVGQARGVDACMRLQETLQQNWSPLTFLADRVSLIWRNEAPDDVFRVYKEIMLGSGEIVDPEMSEV